MGKGNRQRRPARRPPYKEPRPVILVVTEGAVTEPEYLNGFRSTVKNPRVEIHIVPQAGVPRTIVQVARDRKREAEAQARRQADENLRFDEVWCVFDYDEHPNVPNTKKMARDNGIRLAVSNPCIELWLWLHFADQPGMRSRQELHKLIKRHVPNYDKHVDYAHYESGYQSAVRRAARLDEDAAADGEEGRNPSTGMWRLTESIRSSV